MYLNQTLDSVLNQTHNTVEIICVDNGSEDNSVQVIQSRMNEDNRIVLAREEKKGASFARAKGLELAKGEYIQYLDSDDIIQPEKFKDQIAFIESNNVEWVVSDRSVLNQDLSKTLRSYTYEHLQDDPLGVAISEVITSGNPLYKIETVKSVNGYTPSLKVGQDWDFHLKLILAERAFGYLKGDYFQSREREVSLSSNWVEVSHVMARLIADYKEQFFRLNAYENFRAYKKVIHVYFNSAIHSDEEEAVNQYFNEISDWSRKFKPVAALSGANKLICSIFGLRTLVKLKRRL